MHRPQMSLWTLLFLIQLIHTHSTTTTTPSLIAAGHQGIDETLSYYDPLSHPLPTLDHTHEGNHADWHITYKKRCVVAITSNDSNQKLT